ASPLTGPSSRTYRRPSSRSPTITSRLSTAFRAFTKCSTWWLSSWATGLTLSWPDCRPTTPFSKWKSHEGGGLLAAQCDPGAPGGVLRPAPGLLLQFVDALGGVGLGEAVIGKVLSRLLGEGGQVGRLRAGHGLVAGDPLVGVLGRVGGGSVRSHARSLPRLRADEHQFDSLRSDA